MKDPAARPARTAPPDALRCRYLTPTGRRCRSAASGPEPGFCPRHGGVEQARHPGDFTQALIAGGNLQSPEGIHHSLAELFALLARDRISTRRAAVLAYVASLLLRTVGAIDEKRGSQKPSPVFVWDLPAPAREAWTPQELSERPSASSIEQAAPIRPYETRVAPISGLAATLFRSPRGRRPDLLAASRACML